MAQPKKLITKQPGSGKTYQERSTQTEPTDVGPITTESDTFAEDEENEPGEDDDEDAQSEVTLESKVLDAIGLMVHKGGKIADFRTVIEGLTPSTEAEMDSYVKMLRRISDAAQSAASLAIQTYNSKKG